MVKTVLLDGAEAAVTFTGANAWLRNDKQPRFAARQNRPARASGEVRGDE